MLHSPDFQTTYHCPHCRATLPDGGVGDYDDVEGDEIEGWVCSSCNNRFWSAEVYTAEDQYEDYGDSKAHEDNER